MVSPDLLPEFLLAKVTECDGCEVVRRPRMFLCTYHEGFWDGWDTAERLSEGGGDRSLSATALSADATPARSADVGPEEESG